MIHLAPGDLGPGNHTLSLVSYATNSVNKDFLHYDSIQVEIIWIFLRDVAPPYLIEIVQMETKIFEIENIRS